MQPAPYRFKEEMLHQHHVREIQRHSCVYLLNGWKDLQWQRNSRTNKQDLYMLERVISWPRNQASTSRKQHRTCPTLCTITDLHRLASPCRWSDLPLVIDKHPAQLSEIFREASSKCWAQHKTTLTGHLSSLFLCQIAKLYAQAIFEKYKVLEKCLRIIDKTVLGIAKASNYDFQNAVCNGHKRKHALKFETITLPNELILGAHAPMAGSRHD